MSPHPSNRKGWGGYCLRGHSVILGPNFWPEFLVRRFGPYQAALRGAMTSDRLAMNAARRAPRVHGIATSVSSAALVTDLIKRVLVFMSVLLLVCHLGVLPVVEDNMTKHCGWFLAAN